MHTSHNTPLRHFSLAMRLLACFLAFWLWMLPQVLNSSGVQVLCDEYGMPIPVPASEEEEVKHSKLPPLVTMGTSALRDLPLLARTPLALEQPPCSALEEVPHPPPRG